MPELGAGISLGGGISFFAGPIKTVFIKTTGTFTIPADFPGTGTVHCIGAGGRGFNSLTGGAIRHGGGGGAYASAVVSLTASATINVQVGTEGSQTDTWLLDSSTVLAKAGTNATANAVGAGGSAASSIGTTKYDGGTGGLCAQVYYPGGGGGGSAGPSGAGKAGGASQPAGGGGGGCNGAGSTAGTSGTYISGESWGGDGGYSNDGVTGRGIGASPGVAATAGTNGGGGGGGGYFNTQTQALASGANGGMQNYWTQTSNSELAGPSGGGGGATEGNGGTAFGIGGGSTGYGGGSGGSVQGSPTAAAPGLIVLQYTSAV